MKEIGEKLREAREAIGISVDEAAEDLKLRPSQIENIEDGNVEAFQDVFYLKYFIRDYAKYLGLNKEELVDDFNEYLFDYTSKLSVEDIKKEARQKKEEKQIQSPYTNESKRAQFSQIVTYIIIGVLLLVIGYFVYTIITRDRNDTPEEQLVAFQSFRLGGIYESAK